MSKRNAAIYREAARMIAEVEETYSCIAIARQDFRYDDWVRYQIDLPLPDRYVETFADSMDELQDLFGYEDNARNLRVLALCFMAAIEESE